MVRGEPRQEADGGLADAPRPAFDHASEEPLPAGRVLAHALVDRDGLAPALRADADGDEDARVLHVPAPGPLVPHAVHEHVRAFGFQRAFPPLVDPLVDLLEFVAQCPGWHPLAPQQPAGVVHPACAHAREAHLHQRLLDAGFAPPAALDHRRPEHGVVEPYDFIGHGPGLLSNRGFHVQATENRTKAGPCPFHRNPQPNLRKKTGVILSFPAYRNTCIKNPFAILFAGVEHTSDTVNPLGMHPQTIPGSP